MKRSEWQGLTTHEPVSDPSSDSEAEREANASLAVAVIKQAVTDYRKLKESKTETRKIEGGWMCRTAVMKEIEDFFEENGGAAFYLELVGGGLDVTAILKKIKNE
uniref:Uncharacterized protein n=1 Tax=uncultured organism MedDCM-OCT-S11-C235 TaxID=743657 RepID=D6PLB5_9ZZZZ|nr:hypothetical protein [uncultured organism MedDCM-OCT-S11-C235]